MTEYYANLNETGYVTNITNEPSKSSLEKKQIIDEGTAKFIEEMLKKEIPVQLDIFPNLFEAFQALGEEFKNKNAD